MMNEPEASARDILRRRFGLVYFVRALVDIGYCSSWRLCRSASAFPARFAPFASRVESADVDEGVTWESVLGPRTTTTTPHERDELMNVGEPGPAQTAELALLVEMEAHWENLRDGAGAAREAPPTLRDLQERQRAYDAFRARLAAYRKKYGNGHASEALLNTPARLGKWSRAMHELFTRVADGPPVRVPLQLTAKALRWADRVAARTGSPRVERGSAPATVADTLQVLDAVARWCDDLNRAAAAQARPA